MIKGCVFDLDNSLIDDKTGWEVALKKTCLHIINKYKMDVEARVIFEMYEKKSNIFWSDYNNYFKNFKSREEKRRYVWQKVFEELKYFEDEDKIKNIAQIFSDYRSETVILMDSAAVLLEKLKKRGIKIIICTDGEKKLQEYKIQKCGLNEYISECVAADEIGCRKPNREIFDCCIRRSGFKANELLYFGDDYEKDIIGARNAGIKAILLGGEKGCSLYELVEIFDSMF